MLAVVKDTYDGAIYVHRPFTNNDNDVSPANQKKKYKKIEKLIKTYFEEMNIPITLYDEMFSIDSMSAKRLSVDELKKYGLLGLDPYVREAIASIRAKELGITKIELHTRYNRLDKFCSEQYEAMNYVVEYNGDDGYLKLKADEYEECSHKVMNGELK